MGATQRNHRRGVKNQICTKYYTQVIRYVDNEIIHVVSSEMGLAPPPDSLPLLHLLLLLLLLLVGRPEGKGPEWPPGLLLLLLDRSLLALHRAAAVAALGVGASLLLRAVEAVAVGAVRALVTPGPDLEQHEKDFLEMRLIAWSC